MQLLTDKSRLELFTFMHKLPFPVLHNDCPCFAILHLQNQLHAGPHFFFRKLGSLFSTSMKLEIVHFRLFPIILCRFRRCADIDSLQQKHPSFFANVVRFETFNRGGAAPIHCVTFSNWFTIKRAFWGEQATRYAVLPLRQHSPI